MVVADRGMRARHVVKCLPLLAAWVARNASPSPQSKDPEDERGSFLDQYRDAVENARDPAGWKQLRRVLLRWRFHADAVGDPGYREALDAARGPVGSGMLLEDAVRVYRPAS